MVLESVCGASILSALATHSLAKTEESRLDGLQTRLIRHFLKLKPSWKICVNQIWGEKAESVRDLRIRHGVLRWSLQVRIRRVQIAKLY